MEQTRNHSAFREGIKDGTPIALGYFAVSFSLGIAMKNAGLSSIEGFFMSFFNMASAGEYAGIQVIASDASYFQMAVITLITNARYLLMSCAFSQKFSEDTAMADKLLCGFCITDELFGMAIAKDGYLNPHYYYGAMAVTLPAWSFGTAIGIIAGNILPARIVSALSVALYGMFLAVIIPAAKKDKAVMVVVLISFVYSFIADYIPFLKNFSDGQIVIIGTLLIAGLAAVIQPIKEDAEQ